jgi:undecaprenyl-diphosphatase
LRYEITTEKNQVNLLTSFLLGIIQGLTEFIPVSSTAHLLIGQTLLGIPSDDATFAFLVLIQLGTLVSLIVYFWKDFWEIISAMFSSASYHKPHDTDKENNETYKKRKRSTANARLGWCILIATIPALLAGYLLKDEVKLLFRQPLLEAAIRLFAAAFLMLLAEWLSKRSRRLKSITWLDAIVIGLYQILAVFPGASRSAATISGGMLRGFHRRSAARFAFLMSVPVMLAAGGYEMLDVLKMPNLVSFLLPMAIGFVTAAVIGWFVVKWLLGYLTRHSLYPFAAYCAMVGAICLALTRLL